MQKATWSYYDNVIDSSEITLEYITQFPLLIFYQIHVILCAMLFVWQQEALSDLES